MSINLGLKQSDESNELDISIIEPVYGSDKAACFDIRADLKGREVKVKNINKSLPHNPTDEATFTAFDRILVRKGERVLIPTGFIFEIPTGYRMNLVSRSGLSWKEGVIVLNAPATIDEDYTNETFVVVFNTSNEPFTIEHGMRICQAELNPVYRVELESLGGRDGGFGSTGKN